MTPITSACFWPDATMRAATTTAMAVPVSADRLARTLGTGCLEAGGELGDGLEAPAVAVRLEQVRRPGPEADAPAVAHDGVDVGAELLAALQAGDEALPAQVLPGRLEHGADDLGQAPLGQPDVVALAVVVLLVRLLVVGVEVVDHVELREGREELGRADGRAAGLGDDVAPVGDAGAHVDGAVGLGLGVGGQLD